MHGVIIGAFSVKWRCTRNIVYKVKFSEKNVCFNTLLKQIETSLGKETAVDHFARQSIQQNVTTHTTRFFE